MRKLAIALLLSLLVGPASAQLPSTAQIPIGGQPAQLVQSTTGTTGATSVTLTGIPGKFTYICGFTITSAGTTAGIAVTATITGTVNTMNFIYAFVSTGQGILGVALGPGCMTTPATGGNIVLSVPAGGAGTVVAVTAWGYAL